MNRYSKHLTRHHSITAAADAGNAQPETFDVVTVAQPDGTDEIWLVVGLPGYRQQCEALAGYYGVHTAAVEPLNVYCGLPEGNRHLYDGPPLVVPTSVPSPADLAAEMGLSDEMHACGYCMRDAEPSGSCPEHGYLVDAE